MEKIKYSASEKKNRHLLFETNKNLFITGAGGTGKSTFLNEFIEKNNYKIVFEVPENINEDEIVDKISYNCKIKSLA